MRILLKGVNLRTLEPILVLFTVILTGTSLILTPAVDKILLKDSSQYPFFYARSLPFLYYPTVAYSALLALLSRRDHYKLVSLLCVAFLVEFTPSIMLTNPWIPDQYPYLSEPVMLVRKGHITHCHYLTEVPGLGLMFSQLMLITGIGPYTVSKLYPILTVLMLVLPTFIISRELCGNGAVAPLLFLAVNSAEINIFHRSTYFFMLFSFLLLLLLLRIEKVRARAISLITVLTYSATVIIYPGSVIIPLMLLVLTLLLLSTKLPLIRRLYFLSLDFRNRPLSLAFILTLATISIGWYIHVAEWSFSSMIRTIYQALTEITTPTYLSTPKHPFTEGLTPIFRAILRMRMMLIATVLVLGLIGIVYSVLRRHQKIVMSMMYFSLAIILSPFMLFTGLGQWYAFKFIGYLTLLASISASILLKLEHEFMRRTIIVAIILVGLTLLPITRYTSIPYLHVTTEELKAATFVHNYYEKLQPIYYTEYPPYIRVLAGKDPEWEFTQYLGFITNVKINEYSFLISMRHLTRDGYYFTFNATYERLLNSLTDSLKATHNLVYTTGDYTKLFIRR